MHRKAIVILEDERVFLYAIGVDLKPQPIGNIRKQLSIPILEKCRRIYHAAISFRRIRQKPLNQLLACSAPIYLIQFQRWIFLVLLRA